jgi:hypothetical protein
MGPSSKGACPRVLSAIALVLLGGLAAGVPGQAASPPRVGAQLLIESPQLALALGSLKVDVERSVSTWLASEANSRFGFLTWVSALEAGPPPANRWVVRLKERGSSCGRDYFFVFFKISENSPEISLRDLGSVPFDDDCNPLLPTDTAGDFALAVQEKLQASFDNEGFRNLLSALFLQTIPLTSELEVNEQAQALLLPFSFSDLRAGRDSRIAVTFQAPVATDGAMQSGDLVLRAAACLKREASSRIRGEISSFEFAPMRIDQASFWNDTVAAILKSADPLSTRVQMQKYVKGEDPCPVSQPIPTLD